MSLTELLFHFLFAMSSSHGDMIVCKISKNLYFKIHY